MVPILLTSDQTHLTNFSGDKKLWPVYISLGNIHSQVCNKPNALAWIPLAFLPVPPKRLSKIPNSSEAQQGLNAHQIFHSAISYLLQPLSDTVVLEKGLEMYCADEKVYLFFPSTTIFY